MQAMSSGGRAVKGQVVDNIPKRFKELKFGIQSNQDIVNQAVLECSDREMYLVDRDTKTPKRNGLLDRRMGTSSKDNNCETCGAAMQECTGHFGHVRLALPAFHIGYLKLVIKILQQICKDCGKLLLSEQERRSYLRSLRRKDIDNLERTKIHKNINTQCRKSRQCPYCDAVQGQIRKINVLKLVHDKYVTFNKSTAAKKVAPESMKTFEKSFSEARKYNPDLDKHVKKAWDDLNPLRVLNLFKLISPSDCELLGIDPAEGRPEMFLWHYVPAPPVCIRPSTAQDNGSNEDDLTAKLGDIIQTSSLIRSALWKGQPIQTIMEQWEYMQLQLAMYINSDIPGLQQAGFGKVIRGFCQRLKGKQGRFRQNLSGKRVDFSGRTVISPDPNLSIEEVAVPVLVAKILTYPEHVNDRNIHKLRERVMNGPHKWPGARLVSIKGNDYKTSLEFGDKVKVAKSLKVGDIVERHLEDRDIVLFNRQPSLHKLSIMSHYAKIRPWRTFRLNECVCTPYNADFDGDEMNLHVPQTEEARTEAINLMGVKNNLSTPKNGEPIIAATQDFITAAYLLSGKDNFFDRKTFTTLCMYMVNANEHLDLPPPAILKPQALWTGKQVFSMLIRPNKQSSVIMNLDAKCRDHNPNAPKVKDWAYDMCPNDGWLVIRNSEVMCGRMDKTTVGAGKKDSIFYIIMRDFGPDEAVVAMDRLSKLSARYLTNQGFSIGINDVYPSSTLTEEKRRMVAVAYKQVESLIKDFQTGNLEKSTGCSLEETLENKISGILSRVRTDAGDFCVRSLSRWNSPLIMAKSGSKGSAVNVAQMIALVGQQIIGGSRVNDGFQDRSLPHFSKNDRQAPSKGFVRNSFFTGLSPTEFLFHAISGREGLVDTAVKTAETGYMSRRLMKALEDLSTQYDNTVRNSAQIVIQFLFGADNLDPLDMEGAATPVHFSRSFIHAETTTWDNDEPGLLPYEIVTLSDNILSKEREKLPRKGLRHGEPLEYNDRTDYGVDDKDTKREFLSAIHTHVCTLASKLAEVRERAGLALMKVDPKLSREYYDIDSEDPDRRAHLDRVAKVSKRTLVEFIQLCLRKYKMAQTEPGHAVGAVGAQSIGEPGTQMTLKTFHFAGVAGMSITQGVPRIKEIINASDKISTPVITCPLENPDDMTAARLVKTRIERTYIKDIINFVEDMWSTKSATLCLRVDLETLGALQLGIGIGDIEHAIFKARKLKINQSDISSSGVHIFIQIPHGSGQTSRARGKSGEDGDILLRVNHLKRSIPEIALCGYANVTRAIIQSDDKSKNTVLVEGYGLKECMNTVGVVGRKVTSNNIQEMRKVLGIEAARTTIAKEIGVVMGDMGIDPRHMQLLADVMTFKGEILGITRHGLAKMRDSTLQLASFEKTPDHLFDAAAAMKVDKIEGVSESIIMGRTMSIGTGSFQVVRELKLTDEDVCKKVTAFEDAWNWDVGCRKKNAVW